MKRLILFLLLITSLTQAQNILVWRKDSASVYATPKQLKDSLDNYRPYQTVAKANDTTYSALGSFQRKTMNGILNIGGSPLGRSHELIPTDVGLVLRPTTSNMRGELVLCPNGTDFAMGELTILNTDRTLYPDSLEWMAIYGANNTFRMQVNHGGKGIQRDLDIDVMGGWPTVFFRSADGSVEMKHKVTIGEGFNSPMLFLGPSLLPSVDFVGSEASGATYRLRENAGAFDFVNITTDAIPLKLDNTGNLLLGGLDKAYKSYYDMILESGSGKDMYFKPGGVSKFSLLSNGKATFIDSVYINKSLTVGKGFNSPQFFIGPANLPSISLAGDEASGITWAVRENAGTLEFINANAAAIRFKIDAGGNVTATGDMKAGTYYTGSTLGYLTSAYGTATETTTVWVSATSGGTATKALKFRNLTINGVTVKVLVDE